MMEVPVEEAWLFENKDAFKKVLTGLSQVGSVKRGLLFLLDNVFLVERPGFEPGSQCALPVKLPPHSLPII
jgi:hypothetical protein